MAIVSIDERRFNVVQHKIDFVYGADASQKASNATGIRRSPRTSPCFAPRPPEEKLPRGRRTAESGLESCR
jgi:hypothetical protein